MHVQHQTETAAARDRLDAAIRRLEELDEPRHKLVALLVVPEPAEATEAPGEGAILAVDGDDVLVAAAEVGDLDVVEGRDVAVLGPLDVDDDALGRLLEVEGELVAGEEVLAVRVVAEHAVLRASEGMQATWNGIFLSVLSKFWHFFTKMCKH